MDWSTALADPEALRAQGLFLAEGRLVLERIFMGAAGGSDAIAAVLATPAAARALRLEERVPDRLTARAPKEMEAITGFNFHRGVLALVRRPPMLAVRDVITAAVTTVVVGSETDASAEMAGSTSAKAPADRSESRPYPTHGAATPDSRYPLPGARAPVMVVLEHLVDVDNVGSCFRNARAFGAACLLLDERCPDPLYRKAVRTSLGHVLDVPWVQAPILDVLAALREHGVATIGLTPQAGYGLQATGSLRDIVDQLERRQPVAVVVGNEGSGMSAEALEACTHLARIPMAEGADSINVATALAVALYELTRLS